MSQFADIVSVTSTVDATAARAGIEPFALPGSLPSPIESLAAAGAAFLLVVDGSSELGLELLDDVGLRFTAINQAPGFSLKEVVRRSTADFARKSVAIGRSITSDIQLDDPCISRHHAALRQEGGWWMIEDRGSLNGVFVNGELISTAHRLRHGDVIGVGSFALFFVSFLHAGTTSPTLEHLGRSRGAAAATIPAQHPTRLQPSRDTDLWLVQALTTRQLNVLAAFCDPVIRRVGGPLSDRALSEVAGISLSTAKTHIADIRKRIRAERDVDVSTRTRLAAVAIDAGVGRGGGDVTLDATNGHEEGGPGRSSTEVTLVQRAYPDNS